MPILRFLMSNINMIAWSDSLVRPNKETIIRSRKMKALNFMMVLFVTVFAFIMAANSLVVAQIHYGTNGKVGIGTENPGSTLTVKGTIESTIRWN